VGIPKEMLRLFLRCFARRTARRTDPSRGWDWASIFVKKFVELSADKLQSRAMKARVRHYSTIPVPVFDQQTDSPDQASARLHDVVGNVRNLIPSKVKQERMNLMKRVLLVEDNESTIDVVEWSLNVWDMKW